MKPEFLDPFGVLERIKRLRELDEGQYKLSGLGTNSGEILSYFADIEFNNWSYLSQQPLIDMEWIRAGWFWSDKDGDSELVPKIFDNFVPQLVEKLKNTNLSCESDFYVAHAHCMEIIDFCKNPSVAEIQLMNVMKQLIRSAHRKKIIDKNQYETILISCGFQEQKRIWE